MGVRVLKGLKLLIGLIVLVGVFVVLDGRGELEDAGNMHAQALPAPVVSARQQRQNEALEDWPEHADKQILFGDLHVHSTFSMDAFLWSLPMMNGKGVHPPADACDYARYCADLDFWSLTDHAEALTPRHWSMVKDTVRQCNAITNPDNPDLVTFLGWEWTQVGQTPEDHYGHRNVVLRDTEDGQVPARPITSGGLPLKHMRRRVMSPLEEAAAPYITDFGNRQAMKNQFAKQAELRASTLCPEGVHVKDLPADCVESAETPDQLWAKLDQWGFPVMAIPHGTTWGFYSPPGVKWDKQLSRAQHRPEYQPLIEVYSGHGNSEEYRDFRAVRYDEDGAAVCPEPSADYLPCCHRAGELIRERCDDPGSEACQQKVDKAEQDYLSASVAGHLVIPGVQPEDWLNCGQCNDCFEPALNYRAGNSVQAIMALSNFDEAPEANGDPQRFKFGFVASSDNHAAQPGTGFKEVGRHQNTEAFGPANKITAERFSFLAKRKGEGENSVPFDRKNTHFNLFQYAEAERLGSYFYSGGLVAVHASGRDRQSIWDAMQSKEVYATSGPRMLLWFDLLNAADQPLPMGQDAELSQPPQFRVRALGAFEQKPGCPQYSIDALGAERLEFMCGGECYNPGDTRIPIKQIEVIRIQPQIEKDEPLAQLIEDPWKVIPCVDDGMGCSVSFSDPDFVSGGRDTLYYVRALQQPRPTINGNPLNCEADDEGRCDEVGICYGDQRTPLDDDCLNPASARAWSSPIYVGYAGR